MSVSSVPVVWCFANWRTRERTLWRDSKVFAQHTKTTTLTVRQFSLTCASVYSHEHVLISWLCNICNELNQNTLIELFLFVTVCWIFDDTQLHIYKSVESTKSVNDIKIENVGGKRKFTKFLSWFFQCSKCESNSCSTCNWSKKAGLKIDFLIV